MRRALAKLLFATVTLLVFAAPAWANSSSYEFTMNNYYVSGKNNGVFHSLTAGRLTNSGQIWAYEKLVGAGNPYPVYIEVWKVGFLIWDDLMCSLQVTPSTTVNQRTSYFKNCGNVPASSQYYVVASKAGIDGYHLQASGTLTTQ